MGKKKKRSQNVNKGLQHANINIGTTMKKKIVNEVGKGDSSLNSDNLQLSVSVSNIPEENPMPPKPTLNLTGNRLHISKKKSVTSRKDNFKNRKRHPPKKNKDDSVPKHKLEFKEWEDQLKNDKIETIVRLSTVLVDSLLVETDVLLAYGPPFPAIFDSWKSLKVFSKDFQRDRDQMERFMATIAINDRSIIYTCTDGDYDVSIGYIATILFGLNSTSERKSYAIVMVENNVDTYKNKFSLHTVRNVGSDPRKTSEILVVTKDKLGNILTNAKLFEEIKYFVLDKVTIEKGDMDRIKGLSKNCVIIVICKVCPYCDNVGIGEVRNKLNSPVLLIPKEHTKSCSGLETLKNEIDNFPNKVFVKVSETSFVTKEESDLDDSDTSSLHQESDPDDSDTSSLHQESDPDYSDTSSLHQESDKSRESQAPD